LQLAGLRCWSKLSKIFHDHADTCTKVTETLKQATGRLLKAAGGSQEFHMNFTGT
jgi:hypothetical protein